MRTYVAYYKDKSTTVQADTSYAASLKAQAIFKAKYSYQVTVMLADVTHDGSEV